MSGNDEVNLFKTPVWNVPEPAERAVSLWNVFSDDYCDVVTGELQLCLRSEFVWKYLSAQSCWVKHNAENDLFSGKTQVLSVLAKTKATCLNLPNDTGIESLLSQFNWFLQQGRALCNLIEDKGWNGRPKKHCPSGVSYRQVLLWRISIVGWMQFMPEPQTPADS